MKLSAAARHMAFAVAAALWLTGASSAAEVRVMISGGLSAAYNALVPEFERMTGNKVITAYGPSMGTTTNAIPMRLERGEPADVLILVGYALGDLVKQGKVIPDSRIDLVNSKIGVAVKAGALRPDISSADAVKRALLAAKSVAYSDSASGVYISTEMFDKLGIAAEMKDKARKIPATPVAEIVARGEAELGFQQISELKPIAGIDIVGPLPDDLQKVTVFSAGIATVSKEPEAGKALIRFLASPAAKEKIVNSGLEPIASAEIKGPPTTSLCDLPQAPRQLSFARTSKSSPQADQRNREAFRCCRPSSPYHPR
jgi:molybdate transport system substrate-binding protein